jgi:hypothetical protein
MATKSIASGGGGGVKYTPRRQYLPYRRGRYAQAAPSGDFGSGWKIGQSIGGGLGDLANAIVKARQQAAADQMANRMLNTAYAPRAAFVGGAQPKAGVPLTGSAPQTGGAPALQEAIRGQQLMAEMQKQKTAAETMALRQRAAAAGAGGHGGGPWGGGGGSASRYIQKQGQPPEQGKGKGAAKYQPGSSTPTDPGYYDYGHMRADIDNQFGRGTYDKLVGSQGKIDRDPATGKFKPGTYGDVTVKDDGTLVFEKGPTVSGDQVPKLMARYDATSIKQGFKPVYTDQYLGTQNPQSGSAGGTVVNPYTPKDDLETNALPPGSYFVNPKDNKTYQIPGGETAPTTGNVPPGHQELGPPKPTAQVDTGAAPIAAAQAPPPALADMTAVQAATPNMVAAATPAVTPQPVDVASAVPANTPDTFNVGQPNAGLPDTTLADAIRQSQIAQSLQGVA